MIDYFSLIPFCAVFSKDFAAKFKVSCFSLIDPESTKEGRSGGDSLHWVGLWPCLWRIALVSWCGETQATVSSTIPQAGCPGMKFTCVSRVLRDLTCWPDCRDLYLCLRLCWVLFLPSFGLLGSQGGAAFWTGLEDMASHLHGTIPWWLMPHFRGWEALTYRAFWGFPCRNILCAHVHVCGGQRTILGIIPQEPCISFETGFLVGL